MSPAATASDAAAADRASDGGGAGAGRVLYEAAVPGSAFQPGDMIRWKVQVSCGLGGIVILAMPSACPIMPSTAQFCPVLPSSFGLRLILCLSVCGT